LEPIDKSKSLIHDKILTDRIKQILSDKNQNASIEEINLRMDIIKELQNIIDIWTYDQAKKFELDDHSARQI